MTNLPLDQQIDAAHAETERIESEARQIEARILKVGGRPPVRRYGTPVSAADVAKNLTLRSQLQLRDPALATFLGIGSDLHLKAQADAERRAAEAERLNAATAALQARNQAAAEQRYRRQLAPKPAGWRVG